MKNSEKDITLELIARMKEEKRKQIEDQKEKLSASVHALFEPMKPAATKAEAMVRLFNKGMAVFDGVMLGMKIMNTLRSIFRRKRKR